MRQALLGFLKIACDDISHQYLDIRVEYMSLDIAIYLKPVWDDFCPVLSPLIIIEAKQRNKDPVDTTDCEQQIKEYLNRTRCDTGILTNCRSMWLYQQQDGRCMKRALVDLQDITDLLSVRYNQMMIMLQEHRRLFSQAKRGCVSSFRDLIHVYGFHAETTFTFSYKKNNSPVSVNGFLLSIRDGTIRFRSRSPVTSKPQDFPEESFQRLSAITTRL